MNESGPQGVEQSLMTLRQAAEKTEYSATTLRRYIKSGRLRARLIPGRYGPEYVVDDHDLSAAGLLSADGNGEESQVEVAPRRPAGPTATSNGAVADAVPGLLYRELMMKHEHLLVQYGMLRVSGRQLYEVRQESERKAEEARASADELRRTRDKHAREIGELKTRLRRSELELAERNERIRELERRLAEVEMQQRNAQTLDGINEHFRKIVGPLPDGTPPPTPDH